MNKILMPLVFIFIFGCKTKQKNSLIEIEPEKTKSDLILDTLIFDKNMIGKLMTEKYTFGLTKLPFYKQFVSENRILEKQIITEEHTKTEITYLGKLKDLNNINYYHVLTNFKIIGIREMQSSHGISNIAFVNDNLDTAIIYRMEMPDELPKKIENNILYFNHDSEKIGISILGGLPPMLCIPKIGCN